MDVDSSSLDTPTAAPSPSYSEEESSSKSNEKTTTRRFFDRWVDYLPHDIKPAASPSSSVLDKRASLDVTESHLTESQDEDAHSMEDTTQDWPDSASLEDYAMVPNALLVEPDPVLQHELLLTDPSVCSTSANGQTPLHQVLEDRRRELRASMEASQRTRRFLEPHIKQRASWASVLRDIEGSYQSVHQHVLLHHVLPPTQEEEDEEMLASAALEGLEVEEDALDAAVVNADVDVGMDEN